MGMLGLLLKVSQRELSRRLSHGRAGAWGVLGGALGVTLLGAALLPAEARVVSGDDPGGTALEVAFWLTCLMSAVLSFRVMESFFRTGDARILAPLPLGLDALFAYRLLRGLAAVGLLVLVGVLLMSSILWRGDWQVYLACVGVWSGGALTTLGVGFGVQMYAGQARITGESGFDAHGPTAGMMAPGMALAVSVFVILLEKLVAEEFLKSGFNGGARFGLLVSSGITVLSLVAAWRWFRSSFYQMYGRFFEADTFMMDTGYAYFQEGDAGKGWFLRFLGQDQASIWARKDWAQLERRDLLPRLLLALASLGLAAFLGSGGDLGAGIVAAPLGISLLLTNPWAKLWSKDLEPGIGRSLPTEHAQIDAARQRVARVRGTTSAAVVSFAGALGAYVGAIPWGVAAALLGGALAVASQPLLSWAAPRGMLWLVVVGTALVGGGAALGALSIWLVLPLCVVVFAGGFLLQRSPR